MAAFFNIKHNFLSIPLKKIGRIIFIALGLLLVLLLLAWILIQQPAVQQRINRLVTKELSQRLDTRFEIGSLRVSFFDRLLLEDIYLEDEQQDTLLAAGRLEARLSLFSLLGQEMDIELVGLQDATVRLRRPATDSAFNYQFLIDAFSSNAPPDTTSSPSAWRIGLGNLDIYDIRFSLEDELAGQELQVVLPEMTVRKQQVALTGKEWAFGEVEISGLEVRYEKKAREKGEAGEQEDQADMELVFPDPGKPIFLKALRLKDTRIAYRDAGAPTPAGKLDFGNLQLFELTLGVENVQWNAHTFVADWKALRFREKSGLEVKQLQAGLRADTLGLAVESLLLTTPNSRLEQNWQATYHSFSDLTDFFRKVNLEARLGKNRLGFADLRLLVGDSLAGVDLRQSGKLEVRGGIRGPLANMKLNDLQINLGQALSLNVKGRLAGLPRTEELQVDVPKLTLTLQPQPLRPLLLTELPSLVDSLGEITYTGRLRGKLDDLSSSGSLQTGLGDARYELQGGLGPDFQTADYQGMLQLQGVDLARLTADTSFGPLFLRTEFKGSGLRPDSLQLLLSAVVERFRYLGYAYQPLQLQAQVRGSRLESKLTMADPSLTFDLDARADWSDTLPDLALQGQVDSVLLQRLNLYAQPLQARSWIDLQVTNWSPAAPQARLRLHKLALKSEAETLSADSLLLTAQTFGPDSQRIDLHSPFAKASLFGNYHLPSLATALLSWADRYFSLQPLLTQNLQTDLLSDTQFEFQLSLSRPDEVLQLFTPSPVKWDSFSLQASFSEKENRLELSAQLPHLRYAGFEVDSLGLQGREEGSRYRISLGIAALHTGEDLPTLYPELQLQMGKDSLDLRFDLQEALLGPLYGIQAQLQVREERYYRLTFASPFVFSNAEWEVDPGHYIDLGLDILDINRLRFQRGEEIFFINSPDSNALQPLEIGFKHYPLIHLSRLARLDSNFIRGELNGQVRIDQQGESRADLTIADLTVQNKKYGQVRIQAQPEGPSLVRLNSSLQGASAQLNLLGTYGFEEQKLDLEVDVPRLNLSLLDPFVQGFIRDSRGFVSANLNIKGSASQPVVEGSLFLDSISTFVDYLQLRYAVAGRQRIRMDERIIDFGNLSMLDVAGRSAQLSGKIQHDRLSNLQFFLDFSTDGFPFLNTPPSDTSLFYGKILLQADASIRGTAENPRVQVQATTLDSTHLFLLPLTETEAITQRDFVIYGKPPESDSLRPALRNMDIEGRPGLDLSLLMEVLPQARLEVIVDPATGEKLTAQGQGDISVEMDPAGNLRTTGRYELTDGSYLLNYEGLIKKEFIIQSGSNIILTGEPMQSRFDITAIYQTRPQPYALLNQHANLSDQEATAARRRTEVEVHLKLSGTLEDLDLSFDIVVPEGTRGPTADLLRSRLSQIRNDANELNTQVFGLLLFDGFITGGGGQASLTGAGQDLALSSLSNLITNQLNRLAQEYLKGVELELGLESYRSGLDEGTVTELQVGLSKRLFNDRLAVRVGGNVDLESQEESESMTAFAGNFVLEYKLTEDGSYLLRVFSRYDYNLLLGDNINERGAGIMYRKKFGGKKK